MDDRGTRSDLGTYIEHDGRPAVRFERIYPHPVERVWAAISAPEQLVRWFPSAVEIEPREGGTVRFSGDPYSEGSSGVVLTWDPPRRLAFSWGPDELHFTLDDAGEGRSRLVLVNVLDDRSTAARNAGGWHVCLGELQKLLEGVPSKGPHSDDAEPWEPVYQAHIDAGLPSGAPVPDIVTG
jgi:uncharacterized protein YndB with AHSA1/START domain